MNATPTFNPVGNSTSDVQQEKVENNAEYAAAFKHVAFFEIVARIVIGYRMEHDLTQEELAAIVKMPVSLISRLENGEHTVNGLTVDRFCKSLGSSID